MLRFNFTITKWLDRHPEITLTEEQWDDLDDLIKEYGNNCYLSNM